MKKIKTKIRKRDKCEQCGNMDGTRELHSCPYRVDVNDDDTPKCNCCHDCRNECVADI